MKELKPCPFCGATPRVAKKKLAMQTVFAIDQIHYRECYLFGFREPENEGYVDEESAIKAWNNRFIECDLDTLLILANEIESGNISYIWGDYSNKLIADRIRESCGVVE